MIIIIIIIIIIVVLYKNYKQRITPNIFINNKHIGTNKKLKNLYYNGILDEIFPIIMSLKKKKTLEELIGDEGDINWEL